MISFPKCLDQQAQRQDNANAIRPNLLVDKPSRREFGLESETQRLRESALMVVVAPLVVVVDATDVDHDIALFQNLLIAATDYRCTVIRVSV